MEQVSKNQKSMLAKLLATENITVQHQPNAKTAWFDVKNRVLCLPLWREMSNDLYDMLVIHEVGHALDTPAEGFVEAIKGIANRVTGSSSNRAMAAVKGFINVIEDARIDKRQKRRFPGSRRNYIKGYAELIERNFFGTATRDVNSMSFIDRANIYFKGGAMMGIQFSPEERKFIKRMEDAETWSEVLALSEEVFAYAKERNEKPQELDPNDFDMESGEGEGEAFDDFDDDEASEDESEGKSSKSSKTDEDGDEEADEGSDGDDGEGDEASDDADAGSEAGDDHGDDDDADAPVSKGDDASDEENLPEAETDKAWEEKQNELVLNSEFDYVYVNLPKADHSKIVDDYKVVLAEQSAQLAKFSDADWRRANIEEVNRFKAEENATISFMVKEFEMKKAADEYQRTSVAKTGVIDTNKLHSYKYNDDIFRRIATVSAGKNHGFVMFLDWSGSMDVNLKKTVKQLFSLTMFCKRVQIPFEVYTFRSLAQSDTAQTGHFSAEMNELSFRSFKLRNILSSRMKLDELNTAFNNLWMMANRAHVNCDFLGSTPLNEAILAADGVINQFRERNKVQIVNTIFLTDGDADPTYLERERNDNLKKRKYIIQDAVTKKSYDVKSRYGDDHRRGTYHFDCDGRWMTSTLLKILKERTNCNLIGFFIASGSFNANYSSQFGYSADHGHFEKNKKLWNDCGFFAATNAGYDEYYILNSRSMNIVNENLSVSSDMTKSKIAKEFMKFSERKAVNRVLLQRFISKIAA